MATPKIMDATKLTGMDKLTANLPSGFGGPISELHGSQELCSKDVLPKPNSEDREIFEAMGIVFGKEVDILFIACTFPSGWKKVPESSDPRHIHLFDENGRKRAYMFYKNTTYDRDARLEPEVRITIDADNAGEGRWVAMVKDGESILHTLEDANSDYEKIFSKAVDWASQYFPDRNDPLAYWDVEDLKTLIK